ncbi:hypothetical protein F2P44_08860 [Massilia sp. CCM 8695]|uniref:Nitroreductase domain-containing protein n=1 Tax=Massilia frigida TaxID=2609281 RepID=A0ABX0NCB5_9BURK|nr:nitroreductase family protein [Massilia frigida]NHZ79385.1 hypothetical protein [Massilia frigida]
MTTIIDFQAALVSLSAEPSDPQMRLPMHPKLVAGVQPVWHSRECLIMVGGPTTITLRGKAVSVVLPSLLPLLDGTRTLAQIGEQMRGIGARAVQQALMLLFMRGLLVGEPVPCTDPLQLELERDARWRRLLNTYERYLDETRVCQSAGAVLAAMRRGKLLLISDSGYAITVLKALKELGLGCATLLTPHADLVEQATALSDASWDLKVQQQPLDALLAANDEHDAVCAFISAEPAVERALALGDALHGQRLLYAVLGERELRIGPCVDVPSSACLHCAKASGTFERGNDRHYGALELELGAERVAHKLLQLFTHVVAIDSIERSETLDSDTLVFTAQPVFRQFGCSHCAPLSASWPERPGLDLGGARLAPLPWFYHRSSQHAAYAMAPKGHQVHYASKNKQASAGGYKIYRSRPSTALAELDKQSPRFAQLSQLLGSAVGRRVWQAGPNLSFALRLTPSGGNMSSQNVYVLSYEEHTRGCYYFNPRGYWQRLADHAPALTQLGLLCDGDLQPRFALLLTCSHARLESKYNNAAYRYAFYDAGTLVASLQALAPQHEFICHTSAHFDDDAVAALFGGLQTNEFATAVVVLTDASLTAIPNQVNADTNMFAANE